MSTNRQQPNLHFTPGGQMEGFTSAGVQGFSDLNPAAIVRELIQNSLDAVREDGRTETIVRFELETMTLADVPAIDTYRKVFSRAIESQERVIGELPEQAKMVIDAIQNGLGQTDIQVLSVLDNGLGLDTKRMQGLLADGMSIKTSAGAGAIGNGHLTAIPASDLRYVLYGGVSECDGMMATGHAILASFADEEDAPKGKDGYYVLSPNGTFENPYDFVPKEHMASLIKEKLAWIKANFDSQTGTAVIIPAFNHFQEEQDLWKTIKNSAACNFFAAIADGDLKVVYTDESNDKYLDKTNIGKVFEGEVADQKRRRAKNFLSGERAADAYNTVTTGKCFTVDVGCGQATILLYETDRGRSRIDLCRNGMWISDRLPRLNIARFSARKPFHCVIKISSEDGDIHRLIRKSEGPLHNDLERAKSLPKDERQQLRAAFKKIADFLLEHTSELQQEEFEVPDFLSIDIDDGSAAGGRHRRRIGKFESMPPPRPKRSTTPRGENPGPRPPRPRPPSPYDPDDDSPSAFKRSGNPVSFQAVMVPTGARSFDVELLPEEELGADTDAERRFFLDENVDATCDDSSGEQFVALKNITLNDESIASRCFIRKDDVVLGVRLGQFKAGEKHLLSFDYNLPDGIDIQATDKAMLRAEIVRRRRQD